MNKGFDPKILRRVGPDLADILQRRLPGQHHGIGSHGIESVGRGAVDDAKLGAHVLFHLWRVLFCQLQHAKVSDDESVGPGVLEKLQISGKDLQFLLPGQSVAGHI